MRILRYPLINPRDARAAILFSTQVRRLNGLPAVLEPMHPLPTSLANNVAYMNYFGWPVAAYPLFRSQWHITQFGVHNALTWRQ